MKIRSAESPKEVLQIAAAHASDLNEIHSATCLYQIAKMRRMLGSDQAASPVLRDLVDFLDYQTGLMEPYTLANTAWSIAQLEPRLGKHVTKLMPSIVEHSLMTIRRFTPRDLSNLVWACATMRYKALPLLEKIVGAIESRIQDCGAQDIGNLVWGFATLGFRDVALMDTIAGRAAATISGFCVQDLAHLAWGFATLGVRNDPLMDAIDARTRSIVHTFDVQSLGNIAWSYWRFGLKKRALLEGVCGALRRHSVGGRRGKPMIMAWTWVMPAAVSMGVTDKAALAACADSFLRPGTFKKANKYHIATLMRSAQLDDWATKEPEFVRALQQEMKERRIPQAALESELLVEPSKWLATFN